MHPGDRLGHVRTRHVAGSADAVVTVTVTSPTSVPVGGTTLTNTATAPAATGTGVSATTLVNPPPSLSTSITDSPHNVTVNNNVQYTLDGHEHRLDRGHRRPGGRHHSFRHERRCESASVELHELVGHRHLHARKPRDLRSGHGPVRRDRSGKSQATSRTRAIASPGPGNTAGTVTTIVEAVTDGVAKGFVLPGGSSDDPGRQPRDPHAARHR